MEPGSIAAITLGCIFAALLILAGVSKLSPETKGYLKEMGQKALVSATHPEESGFFNWAYITPMLLVVLIIFYASYAGWYKQQYGQYRSTPASIQKLLIIRRRLLSNAIQPLSQITDSVANGLITKTKIYGSIPENQRALVNWRPLTARLVGYLGGINSARDGVFDMDMGVTLALAQGARAFVFDIDYLDDAPCAPLIMHRDSQGILRSLHTGSIAKACSALAKYAFTYNYDPILVILYIRRMPSEFNRVQRDTYLKAIASALDPLSSFHLGSNEFGNFHNARNEIQLFTRPITNYQKKFIVLTNFDTNTLSATQNPKDNLDFWTNARIYKDPSGLSSSLGNVTPVVDSGKTAYVQVGSTDQFLNINTTEGSIDMKNYISGNTAASANTFKISLSDVEYIYTVSDLKKLMNTLGIQCVPMDVIALSALPEHKKTLTTKTIPAKLSGLSVPTNLNDPLSFWTQGGWSRKYIKTTSATVEGDLIPIDGFIIQEPVAPVAPSPRTNSNGGLVNV